MVLGAGIGGILAASVLARHYAEVIIVERDRIPERPIDRRGVPQGKHPHILLRRGEEAIRRLLPGALERLRARDLTPMDIGHELRWFHAGVWKARHDPGFRFHTCDRVRLEHALRAEALALPNVALRQRVKVVDWVIKGAPAAIGGVVLRDEERGEDETLAADVVVDASGRGSPTPRLLAAHGFGEVAVSEVECNVGYSTRVFHLPDGNAHLGLPIAVFPDPPRTRRAGLAFPLGDNGVIAVLAGWGRDYVPTSGEGFVDFAETLDRPEIAALLRDARPSPSQHTFRARANTWRRFDQMRRWPEGLVVVGDAVCALNPMYGQGMTIAAIEAEALGETLEALARGRRRLEARAQAQRMQRRIASIVRFPWLLVSSEDLRHPTTLGPRPRGLGLIHRVTSAIHELVAYDRLVHRRVFEVLNLMRSPLALLDPRVLLQVARHRLRGAAFLRALREAETPVVLAEAGADDPRGRGRAGASTPALAAAPTRDAAPAVMKPASLTFSQWRAITRSGKLVQLRHIATQRRLSQAESADEGDDASPVGAPEDAHRGLLRGDTTPLRAPPTRSKRPVAGAMSDRAGRHEAV